MSIRYIGYESYVPITPGNFAKGTTKVIQVTNPPDQYQIKNSQINKYR